jgi:hypothetical protein
MIFWIRKEPTDFGEILAGIERGDVPGRSTRRTSGPAVDAPPSDAARSRPSAADTGRPVSKSWRRIWSRLCRRSKPQPIEDSGAAPSAPEVTEASPNDEPAAAPPQRPPRTENEVIAEELGLDRRLGREDLQQLRREFAKRNHPDRCPPAQRRRAARRMSIANMLIDEKMKPRP